MSVLFIGSCTFLWCMYISRTIALNSDSHILYLLEYSESQARANSVHPDQMPHSVASDQGIHCLSLIQQCLDPKNRE